MTILIKFPDTKEAIAALYDEARLQPPSVEACITPLRDLVGSLNLNCVELPKLTSRTATEYLLLRRGSPASQSDNVDDAALAGYLHVSPNFGCIFVNELDPVTRRRFSVAHELGHYVRHFRPVLDYLKRQGELLTISVTDPFAGDDKIEQEDSEGTADRRRRGRFSFSDPKIVEGLLPSYEQMEGEANDFAAELLMPSDAVREQAVRFGLPKDDLAWKLASEMLVSRSAMYYRLEELQVF
jgi:hypothetical protein